MSPDTSEIHDYMQYARECWELAAKVSSVEYKRMLEAMADRWAQLASDQKGARVGRRIGRSQLAASFVSEIGASPRDG